MTTKKMCKEKVWDDSHWHQYDCDYKANPKSKDGEYCLTHCPDRKAERAAKRGPGRFELELQALGEKRRRNTELREAVNSLLDVLACPCTPDDIPCDQLQRKLRVVDALQATKHDA